VSKDGVKFTVTNTGKYDGAEVAQLYVGKKDSAVIRPEVELKGFKKVFIKAGESAEIQIPFDKRSFRAYNAKAGEWQIEGGEYVVSVGASCTDIKLTDKIAVDGNATDFGYDRNALRDYFSGNAANVPQSEFETLLGRAAPEAEYPFYKKNRMVIHENCTVDDLRYSRRWIGRAFSGLMRFAHNFCWAIGQKPTANMITMGVLHQPVRGLAKYGGMTRKKMEGLLRMFNGKNIDKAVAKAKKKQALKTKK